MAISDEELPLGDRMKVAVNSLENGSWKLYVQKGLDDLAAGEKNLKWLLFYSGISSHLPEKLHTFVMGRSQRGKSYLPTQIGNSLFPDVFLDVTDLSPKAIYYEAKEKKKPDIYEHKILFIDEFHDVSQDTKNFIKKITSHKRGVLTLKTVVDHKFLEVSITGVPVVWTNSMEAVEDAGNQILNRFIKSNVNETLEQSREVEKFQKERIKLGERHTSDAVEMARRIIDYIFEEADFQVINPFIEFVRQADYSVHSRLPQLQALVGAISYANWRRREIIKNGGQRFIISSLADTLEALILWHENERFQLLSVPQRYLKFLEIFDPDLWLDTSAMSESHFLKHKERLSADSCYQYAHQLEQKDILTSRPKGQGRGKEWSYPSEANDSINRSLGLIRFTNEMLAGEVDDCLIANSISTTETARIVNALLDAEIPKTDPDACKQMNLDVTSKESSDSCNLLMPTIPPSVPDLIEQTVQEVVFFDERQQAISYIGANRGITNEKFRQCWPTLVSALNKLLLDGWIGTEPSGALFVAKRG